MTHPPMPGATLVELVDGSMVWSDAEAWRIQTQAAQIDRYSGKTRQDMLDALAPADRDRILDIIDKLRARAA